MTPLRKRLFYPPNSVPDTGIDLSKPLGIRHIVYSGVDARLKWRIAQQQSRSFDSQLTNLLRQVAIGFETPVGRLTGTKLSHPLVFYRQAAMAIVRRLSSASTTSIGRAFNRDHTTAVHAINQSKIVPFLDEVAAELPEDATALEWAKRTKRKIDSWRVGK